MKKSLLMLTASFLLVGALAGCDDTSTSGSTSTGGNVTGGLADVTLPTEEGKITAAFQLSSESVAIPEYVSIYLTGCYTEKANDDETWNTEWGYGYDATKMLLLDGTTDIYYAFIEWDAASYGGEQAGQYSLVAGYNETAELGASQSGLQWVDSYKSAEVVAYAYPNNPVWTEKSANVVWLTTEGNDAAIHTFTSVPSAPVILHNYHITVGFVAEIPDYAAPYILGTMNNWGNDDDFNIADWKLSAYDPEGAIGFVADHYYYEINVGDVIANSPIQYQIVLMAPDATGEGSWTYQFGNAVTDDEGNVTYNNNIDYTPYESDGDDYYALPHEFVRDPNAVYPDPSLNKTVEFRFVNLVGGGTIPEGTTPHLCGNITDWKTVAFEWDDANGYYTLDLSVAAGEVEAGVIADSSWTGKIVAEGGGNLKFNITDATTLVTIEANYAFVGVGDPAYDGAYAVATVTVS